MAKRGKARQVRKAAAGQEAAQTALERDQERYGEVLYSATYDIDDDLAQDASALYGSPHLVDASLAMAAAGVIGLMVTIPMGFHNAFASVISLILAVSGSTASGNWHNVQTWAIMGTNLGDSKDDLHRHLVVTEDAIHVEGPGAEVATYPLSELKRVRHDEKGCLASFGKARVAYFPAGSMSKDRLRDLEALLEERAK